MTSDSECTRLLKKAYGLRLCRFGGVQAVLPADSQVSRLAAAVLPARELAVCSLFPLSKLLFRRPHERSKGDEIWLC